MTGCFVVSGSRSSGVVSVARGHFTSPDSLSLVVAFTSHLQICNITSQGVVPIAQVPVYGRIAAMQLFALPGVATDCLFISTESNNFCVLSFDPVTQKIETRAAGDTSSRTSRIADTGQIGIIDPQCRVIALRIYDGLLKIIPISGGRLQEAFDVRLEELQVLDIQFLDNCATPTIAVLWEDQDARHVKSYEINIREKELVEAQLMQSDVDPEAEKLIPVPAPRGGLIVLGETTVSHLVVAGGRVRPQVLATPKTCVTSYAMIDSDGSRYVLGDDKGVLYMLALVVEGDVVKALKRETLGVTSPASALAYLDEGAIYVGSLYGDSQVVRLRTEADEQGGYFDTLDTLTNIGPIVDMCVVDLDKRGQNQVVTCSGNFHSGSLRVIRNGIGIHEQASIEMPGIQGVWTLKDSTDTDAVLALGFVGQTAFLALGGEELEGTEIPGALAQANTLHCGNAAAGHWLQVTEASVRLINAASRQLAAEWVPADKKAITVCAANLTQAIVATGDTVHVFSLLGGAITHKCSAKMAHEVACLDMTPPEGADASEYAAVGLWTEISVNILRLEDLKVLSSDVIGGEMIPRSIKITDFEGQPHVLCALGDGSLIAYHLDRSNGSLAQVKKVQLGTRPISIFRFQHGGANHIFACSDQPAVVYSNNNKLLFSNVDLSEVSKMCSLNTEAFPNCLALVTKDVLTIGTIDEIQKLQIRTVPLQDTPYRIAHHPAAAAFCVLTHQEVEVDGSMEVNGFVRLYHDRTFDEQGSFRLEQYELPCSVVSCTFEDDASAYLCVGTAIAKASEPEPQQGRILVFKVVDSKLHLESQLEVKGAVYSLEAFNGKLLAGINSRVVLYRWGEEAGGRRLVSLCTQKGHILALHIKSRGDFILVGDLMSSITLLVYKPIGDTLEEVATDRSPNWMSAIEIIDDDTFLGCENSFNLFIARRNSGAASDEERQRLDTIADFHLGDFVNVIRPGSLAMRTKDQVDTHKCFLFGTVSGCIGTIIMLSAEEFALFKSIETQVSSTIKGIGGFSHEKWRCFKNEKKKSPDGVARGVVDGDLIEAFLELPRDKMEEVAAGVKITNDAGVAAPISVEELIQRVEDMARLH